ncbi:hypothetical protein GCM10010174_13110 [Kutzneria viridogrisea]|uniref:Secreted protein n=1 Tax=Kutzneria viridogrisea TaxID=47990 RepID=A0ABR6BHV9_9PSEU|nr:hypothetical protein [Kutzneria viridogrisea]
MRAGGTAVTAVAVAVLAAGCAAHGSIDSAAGPPSSATPTSSGTCQQSPTVTATDNGRTVCVTAGGTVLVSLKAVGDSMWNGVEVDNDALVRDPHPKIRVPQGETDASFVAKHAGTVKLSAARPLCPSSSNGPMRCAALEQLTVTVEVR